MRKYGKAQWDQEPSSLDPIDDIQTFYDYDFRLPPEDYDAYQAAAKLKLDQLEDLKDAPGACVLGFGMASLTRVQQRPRDIRHSLS